MTSSRPTEAPDVAAPALLRPWWRRSRIWFALAALVICAGFVQTAVANPPPGRPLDPNSASKNGSLALAQLLRQRGVAVHRETSLDALPEVSTVLVTDPELYTNDQLRLLAAHHRLVLVEAGSDQLALIDSGLAQVDDEVAGARVPPGCRDPGPVAAGVVAFSSGLSYADESCYEGRVVIRDGFVAIGSADLLTNRTLGAQGVAALAINLITNDGQVTSVSWLLSADDPAASQTKTVWSLFPYWTPHLVWWFAGLGLLVALWRGRRLAPVITEPLPVVVRAAEVVEGHGRLYRRARARQSAAAALRSAATRRLALLLGLSTTTEPATVAALIDRPGASDLLVGPVPADDAELARLAQGLADLEDAVAHSAAGSSTSRTVTKGLNS
ncbi:hypothetical protein SAMN05444157_2881 [Frankineae bacterium MT45]|nr:hypothetical protein SAMN05444157_2881 [Frankineae bacterium MT45]